MTSDLLITHGDLLRNWVPEPLIRALRGPSITPAAAAAICAHLDAARDALEPFAPAPVASRLRASNPPFVRSEGEYLHGTVLLADILGLTALSGQLVGSGRQADETVSAIVSALLAGLVAEIHAWGGGVVKLGGDTLTAVFDARRLGDDHAALACRAALGMQAQLARDTHGLRLRAALSSGRILAVEVGDSSHRELLVTGNTISRVARALVGAAPGEVVLTDRARQLVPAAEVRLKVADQHVLLALPGVSEVGAARPPAWRELPVAPEGIAGRVERVAALHPYAPHLPAERLQTGSGEFRPVTVVYANFSAFSRLLDLLELPALIESDPTIVGHVLNTYYTRIQSVFQRFGGTVAQIDLATYGDRFLALFGAPTAHEDDPARAVQAAVAARGELYETSQALTALLREWGAAHPEQQRLVYLMGITLRQRVGIASGSVFAGVVGAPERREYAVVGQPLHLAARLLTAAEDNETLLGEETRRAVTHLIGTAPRDPVAVEGSAQLTPAYRALQQHADLGRAARALWRLAPMVGRDAELARALDLAQHALRPGGGRVLTIEGEQGVGKSRLADELLRGLRTRAPAAAMIQEACQSYEQSVPYAVVVRLLRRLLYVPATDQAAQQRALDEQISDLLPGWVRFTPLLAEVLGLPACGSDLTRALSPEQQRDRLHDLIVLLCQTSARRRPLAIVVDDVQWADASSREVLLRLAEGLAGSPILLTLVTRPLPSTPRPWAQLPHAESLTLRELSQADSEMLVAAILDGALPDEMRPMVERTNGMPLFVEETVRYLMESGALERGEDGTWVCTRPITPGAVPTQIEQIMMARLDQIGASARSLAEVAAVIGQRFTRRLLAEVTVEGRELDAGLGSLVAAGVLVAEDDPIEPAYRFRHPLVRDVAYGSILYARRHQLHAQVAAAVTRVHVTDLDEHRVVLAQHYLLAGESEAAFPHLVRAAQRAQARYANSEAIALYQQAIAIAPQRGEANEPIPQALADLYERLGDVLALTGDYAAARASYDMVLRSGVAEDARARALRRAALQRRVGGTYDRQGNLVHALEWLGRAAETILAAEAAEGGPQHAHILSDMGWVHFRSGALEEAQGLLERALDLPETGQDHDTQAQLLNRLGGIAWSRGNLAQARAFVERSLALSVASGNLPRQADSLNNLGLLVEQQGAIDESIALARQAVAIHEQIGSRRDLGMVINNIGYALYNQGSYDEARAALTQALDRSVEVRDTYLQMTALLNLGRVAVAQGQWLDATHAIEQAQFFAAQLGIGAVQADCSVVLAEVALGQEDLARARREVQQARAIDLDPNGEEQGRVLRVSARIAHAEGDVDEWHALLDAAERCFSAAQNVTELRRTLQLRAAWEQAADAERSAER